MDIGLAFGAEARAALIAFEWLGPHVVVHVRDVVGHVLKRLPASPAAKQLLSGVELPVIGQLALVGEPKVAVGTVDQKLVQVSGQDVLAQPRLSREPLGAERAVVPVLHRVSVGVFGRFRSRG